MSNALEMPRNLMTYHALLLNRGYKSRVGAYSSFILQVHMLKDTSSLTMDFVMEVPSSDSGKSFLILCFICDNWEFISEFISVDLLEYTINK